MKDEVRIAKAEKLNKTMLSVPKEDRTADPLYPRHTITIKR